MPSIIVPARNNPQYTGTCLETLLYSVTRLKLSAEFILIDDNSEPEEGITELFRKHRAKAVGHQVKIVRAKKRQHYTGVFSAGLNLATRDAIFFISNDMFVTPSFLEAQLAVSSLSREIGIVRGTSNYVDSHPEHIVPPPTPLKSFQDVDQFSRTVLGNQGLSYTEDFVLSGDAILVKRSLIERIGVLDLRFFGYFGDVDFGMRAHLAGFKLVCAKGAWLYHEGSGHVKREIEKMPGEVEARQAARMQLVNEAYQLFRKKWNVDYPEAYDRVQSLFYFDHARNNADRVELKYTSPSSFMDEFEVH